MLPTKTTTDWHDKLRQLGACKEAMNWALQYKSAAKAWRECKRADWMLWVIGKLSGEPESNWRKNLVLCACECARLSLEIFESRYPHDSRVRRCLEVAEAWANDKATIEELRQSRDAAYAAYTAADAAYAAYTAADAAYAAYAAAYAAYAAADAADAAYAAYAAAYAAYAAADAADAAYAASRSNTLAKCADIVRKHYPKPPRSRTE